MHRFITFAAFALFLTLAAPAGAFGAEPVGAAALSPGALVEVRGAIRHLWDDARGLRDAMSTLRRDGALGAAEAQAQMEALLSAHEACRAELKALRLERDAILVARRVSARVAMLAAR